MNLHLDNAIETAAKLEALLHVIDETYMEDADSREQYLHSMLKGLAAELIGELNLLALDKTVVDAVYAVNFVNRNSTLTKKD